MTKRLLTGFLVLVGFASGAIGIYVFLFPSKTDLTFEVLSAVNVLDIRDNIEDLQINFQEKNLEKEKLNLRIYTVRIANTGDVDILQNLYDQNNDWGIEISEGKIIRANVISKDSSYISNNLNPTIVEDRKIKFEKIIIEKNISFSVNILALHSKSITPELKRFGKIAGIKEESARIVEVSNDEGNFLATLFSQGSILINLIRFILDIFLAFLILLVTIFLSEKIPKLKRGQKIRYYRRWKNLKEDSDEHKIIFSEYIDNNDQNLRKLIELLKNPSLLKKELYFIHALQSPRIKDPNRSSLMYDFLKGGLRGLIKNLKKIGAIEFNSAQDNLKINNDLQGKLRDFLEYLDKNKSTHMIQ